MLALCSQFAAAYITDDPNDPLRCIPSKTPIVYHYNATFTGSKFYYSQDSDTLTVKNHTYATAAYEQTDTIKFVKQVKGVTPSTISVRYAVNALSWSIGEFSPNIVSSHAPPITHDRLKIASMRPFRIVARIPTYFPCSRTHVILHFHSAPCLAYHVPVDMLCEITNPSPGACILGTLSLPLAYIYQPQIMLYPPSQAFAMAFL